MKIAIVNNQAPFVRGGAELLAEWLADKLQEHGHEAQIVRLPFAWSPSRRVIDHMLATRLVRLPNVERVVALKFPAYYVRHENKVLWMLHQFRQAYDLWGTPYQDLPDTPEGHEVRSAVLESDRRYLKEPRRIYTNSKIVGERLAHYSGISSEVLYPPLPDPSAYLCDGYGDYFFCPGRITLGKRQHLALEAMGAMRSHARLVIAGAPERPQDLDRLRAIIAEHGLEQRVTLLPRWIDDDEKLQLLAGARAVLYLPYGEDSYGYVTLEAFHARKPVITLADSGGTLELVRDRQNGRVVSNVVELAEALDELADDDGLAERWGQAALATIDELEISWQRVIRCLTT
jgi:glycosyltransferase involved in cell wall biosynthesis